MAAVMRSFHSMKPLQEDAFKSQEIMTGFVHRDPSETILRGSFCISEEVDVCLFQKFAREEFVEVQVKSGFRGHGSLEAALFFLGGLR